MLPESCAFGVKEWAVVTEAIRAGKQCYLLKKGGLIEPDHPDFDRPAGAFGLIPTWKRQSSDLLRAQSTREYVEQLEGDDESETITVSTVVDVTEQIVLINPIRAHRLWDCHVWRADHITERINTRPEVPLHLLFIRAYALEKPIEIKRPGNFDDMRHWVALEQELSLGNAKPILVDPAFKRETRIVRELLHA